MNPNPKQQLIERLQGTTNVLITVSANPSVDQLAACIGLTLFLNKMGKHATAVFSGKVPSTIEFLKPEATLEKNTNSLRDFIIALDKAKADKLRYKVEDKIVKIFITPYRTSLSQDDFEFGQGDFNVDVVIALGVKAKEDLDTAITAHGRILHDATVVSINSAPASAALGAINWNEPQASSLCEMVSDLTENLQSNSLDAQMATALLTGIVAQTARFSNNKTTPLTMSLSAKLMAAGANQQLVASKLQAAPSKSSKKDSDIEISADGTLEIEHEGSDNKDKTESPVTPVTEPAAPVEMESLPETPAPQPTTPSDNQPEDTLPLPPLPSDLPSATDSLPSVSPARPTDFVEPVQNADPVAPRPTTALNPQGTSRLTVDPPTMGGTLTANSRPEDLDPSTDPMSARRGNEPILTHRQPNPTTPLINNEPLSRVEQEVNSPHIAQQTQPVAPEVDASSPESSLDAAREAVEAAAAAAQAETGRLDPVASLGAQPLDMNIQDTPAPEPAATPGPAPSPYEPADLPSLTQQAPPSDSPAQVPDTTPPSPVGGVVDATMPSPMSMPMPISNSQPPAPAPMNPTDLPGNLTSQAPAVEQTGVNQPPSPPPVPPPMMPPS